MKLGDTFKITATVVEITRREALEGAPRSYLAMADRAAVQFELDGQLQQVEFDLELIENELKWQAE